MFRVPADPVTPTFDDTFKVGFVRWLTSRSGERHEWMRRRNAAAELARQGQNARAQAWGDRKVAEANARKAARKARRRRG